MKQENWVESQWLKSVELKKKLPFEDAAFVELYRAILLRNVEFCKVVTLEDKQSCVKMTNKFIHQAVNSAFGVQNKEINIHVLLKKIAEDYSEEKSYYFFYIIFKELYRRKNSDYKVVLDALRKYNFPEKFKKIFKTFDCKLAWDYLLTYLAHEPLDKSMFSIMWLRYKSSLLRCNVEDYKNFVFRQYLKDDKNKPILNIKNIKENIYTPILKRAEINYSLLKIF
ncbi:MAG: hypothetical protein ISQ95_04295 [Flavobacteriales bacterium]|nr:hypothetical protein [Flavobacteriales bacterium]